MLPTNKGCPVQCTEVGERVGPRLGESRVLTPSGHVGEFTQPRAHSFAQLYILWTLSDITFEEAMAAKGANSYSCTQTRSDCLNFSSYKLNSGFDQI